MTSRRSFLATATFVVLGRLFPWGAPGIEEAGRVIDMSDTIYLLDPSEAPLTALTEKLWRTPIPAFVDTGAWADEELEP